MRAQGTGYGALRVAWHSCSEVTGVKSGRRVLLRDGWPSLGVSVLQFPGYCQAWKAWLLWHGCLPAKSTHQVDGRWRHS